MSSEKTHGQDAQTTVKDDTIPDPNPIADPSSGGVLSNISASTSYLLSSITGPSSSASLITGSLASSSLPASTKSSNQQYCPPGTYSPAGDLSTDKTPSLVSTSKSIGTTSGADGFRSRQSHQFSQQFYSIEDEFTSFERQPLPQLHEAQQTSSISGVASSNKHFPELESDGQGVVSLLSQPLTSAIYSPDLGLQGIELTNPTIRLFAACDDPVEFLSSLDVYTEAVWGNALEVVRQAREEIMADRKGKRKQDISAGAATERLRMIWGHLKGTPV